MALERWKQRARRLKRETYALYLVARHPQVPWYVKALAIGVAGYALSPIDLIPDFVPFFGYLDDIIIVPLGIALVIRLTPQDVLAECRSRAQDAMASGTLDRWLPARIATMVILSIWMVALVLLALFVIRTAQR